MNDLSPTDPWAILRSTTNARVGLGRSGTSLPTSELLALRADHLRARQAVLADFDPDAVVAQLADRGIRVTTAQTLATDRADYLRHPGRGRRLTEASRDQLAALRRAEGPWDVVFMISDGLSHEAAARSSAMVVATTLDHLERRLRVAPVIVVERARVGLLSDVGAAVGARLAVILLGERPGLSATDGLSAYLEFAPGEGRTDADRNCISNIRPAGGLPLPEAGRRLARLIAASLQQELSGTGLKIELGDPPQSLGRSSIGT